MCGDMRVLVRRDGEKRQIAALCTGRLMEYAEEEGAPQSSVGAVLLGQVGRVLPTVGAAFVKIGQPKSGFLPLTEMASFQQSEHHAPLLSGREAIVQVKKDAVGEKGAFLTRDIALPGMYLVYMPLNRHVGVSSRVKDEAERTLLLAQGKALSTGEAGVIMRHAALAASASELSEEWEALRAAWADITQKATYTKPPAVLYREPSELGALLRDHAARYHITVCAEANMQSEIPKGIIFEEHSALEMDALWQGANVSQQLADALRRKVSLAGGGTLVIDEREALTTIDVNSATRTDSGAGGLALRQNLAACEEIARQLRLRNLGGILLIDFMDMPTDEEREQVQSALAQQLLQDRVKTVLHGFTKLGLLEMTRKRTRESLRSRFTEPCKACGETGRKSVRHE